MKLSELNEYLQTLAAFGAIIALITASIELIGETQPCLLCLLIGIENNYGGYYD